MKLSCLIVLISVVCATARSPPRYDDQQSQPVIQCAVPLILAPVCGSDGVTYDNKWALECEQRDNPDLYVESQGSCDQEPLIKIQEPVKYPKPEKIVEPILYQESEEAERW